MSDFFIVDSKQLASSGDNIVGVNTASDGRQAFLIIGDSTSAGSNNSTGNGPAPVSGTAYYYRRATTDIVEMATDIVAAPLGSQYPQFCTSYYNGSGKKAVIIPAGVGGSNFVPRTGETANWSTTGTCYALAVTDANNALAQLGLTKLKCIFLSSLGINDARGDATLNDIEAGIESLISRLQADFPDTDILIEQIGRSEVGSLTSKIGSVRKFLKAQALAKDQVFLMGGIMSMTGAGGYGADNLHPNQTGNNWRGEMYARWMLNSTHSKWARSIIASHFDDLSTARKNLIATFIDSNLTAYLEHDMLFNFKTTTVNNTYSDWCFLAGGFNTNSVFTANDSIATNGSSTYFRDGYVRDYLGLKSEQNDTFGAVKIKTNSTAAGTLATAYGGSNGTSAVLVQQTAASLLGYRVNDNTATTSNSETAFSNNSEYLFGRSGTGKFLYKDGVQVGTATQASVSVNTTQSYVGAFNSNGTANTFLNGTFEYIRAGKFTTVNHATFKAAMDTLLASW